MLNVIQSQGTKPKVEYTKKFSAQPSVSDNHSVSEQLLSIKRGALDLQPRTPTKKFKIEKSEKSTAYKSSKPKQESSCRLLPKHATDILKDWILSPENFSHPYPTEIEKKMLMEKTGINSKQLKYWFTNARRRLWKQKYMEQQQLSNVHNIQQTILQRLVPGLINKTFPNPAGIAHHDSIGNLQRIISIRNYNSNGHDFIKRSSSTLNLTQPMPNQFNGV